MLLPLPRRSLLKSWQLKFEVIWFWLISPSGTMGRGQTLEGLGGKWEGVKSAFDTVCLSSSNKSWSWWGKGQSGFRTRCNFLSVPGPIIVYPCQWLTQQCHKTLSETNTMKKKTSQESKSNASIRTNFLACSFYKPCDVRRVVWCESGDESWEEVAWVLNCWFG